MTDAADRIARLRAVRSEDEWVRLRPDVLALCDDFETLAATRDAARELYLAWLIGTANENDRAHTRLMDAVVDLPDHDQWLESRKGTPIAPRDFA